MYKQTFIAIASRCTTVHNRVTSVDKFTIKLMQYHKVSTVKVCTPGLAGKTQNILNSGVSLIEHKTPIYNHKTIDL